MTPVHMVCVNGVCIARSDDEAYLGNELGAILGAILGSPPDAEKTEILVTCEIESVESRGIVRMVRFNLSVRSKNAPD